MCHIGPSSGRGELPAATASLCWGVQEMQVSYRVNPRENMSADGYRSLEASSSGAMYLEAEI